MTSKREIDIIDKTKSWIEDFVLHLGLCPFARRPFETDRIHYKAINTGDTEEHLNSFYILCERLLDGDLKEISTAFLVIGTPHSFEDLLDTKSVCDTFLKVAKMDTHFQTVAFHPNFIFAGKERNLAPGHYVNRSPFGMIHIIRSTEMNEATDLLEDGMKIANQNKVKMEKIGFENLDKALKKYKN